MAVFSTIAAIAASITIAQVATAAMFVGTALSIAGAVTGNSTLKYVGMGIGIAGGLTSLAGAFGLFDPSTTISGLFSSSDVAAQSAAAAAPTAAPAATPVVPSIDPTSGVSVAQYGSTAGPYLPSEAGFTQANQAAWLNGQAAPYAPGVSDMGAAAAQAPPPGLVESQASMGVPGGPNIFGPPTPGVSPTAPLAPAAPTPLAAPSAPGAPTVDGVVANANFYNQAAGPTLPGQVQGIPGSSITGFGTTGIEQVGSVSKAASMWEKLDPIVKYGLVSGTIQAGAGAMGGMFQSMSASERLEFDKLVQEQRNQILQGQLNLEQNKFARATSTPGVISFGRR